MDTEFVFLFAHQCYGLQIMPDKKSYDDKVKDEAARETFETVLEISKILNTGLDDRTLSYCVRLCENGVHPEAIARVITEIRHQIMNIQERK